MAQDRPAAGDLLDAVREFLEELLSTLEGDARFKTRVSIHLLGVLAREGQHEAAHTTAELARLRELLGRPDGELADLNAELARRIRAGAFDAEGEAVFSHVLRTVANKLRIVNPRHLARSEPE